MTERDLQILQSFAWAVGVLLLIALAALAVVVVRRRALVMDNPAVPPSTAGSIDWIGLLTSVQADRIPPTSWLTLGATLTTQVATCPLALRAPLVAALDAAIARSRDPLASASMSQVRHALAVLPTA
ncbi:MAG: hypothetical protein H0W78_06765 [Planctomycetes bacterium]|nr:hypothetical protein [Planctomycetota bacterium]